MDFTVTFDSNPRLVFLCFSSDTAVGCPEHNNRPLEFYDKDDDQPVCAHCVVIGERQTHAIVPIDDIVSVSTSVDDGAPNTMIFLSGLLQCGESRFWQEQYPNLIKLRITTHFSNWDNGPFAASGHMVHAGGQAAHWDIQSKENSNLS